MTIILSACSSQGEMQSQATANPNTNSTTNNEKVSVSSPSEDVKQTVSEENIKAEVNQLVTNAFDALVKGDFKDVGQYFSNEQLESSGISAEAFGKEGLATTPEGKDIKYTDYKIAEVIPYDDKHAYVKVLASVETDNEKAENKNDYMAVLEDEKWKLQTNLVVDKIDGLTIEEGENIAIKLSIVEANRQVNGIGFKLNLENVHKNKQLGYKDHPFEMYLLTDEGTYRSSLPGINEFPLGATAELKMTFEGAKGKPLALTFSNVNNIYNLKSDGMPEYKEKGETYFLESITEERAIEIGESLFNYLARTDLQPDEQSAMQYLTNQFGDVTSKVPRMALESAEYSKYEDVKVTYSNHNVYYNKEWNNIHFEANVEIEYKKKDGSIDIHSFKLNSNIFTNDVTGNYSYFFFELQ